MYRVFRVNHRGYIYGPYDGVEETVKEGLSQREAETLCSNENSLSRMGRKDGFLYLYTDESREL